MPGILDPLRRFASRLTARRNTTHRVASPAQYPVYPPAAPADIVADREAYTARLRLLRFAAPLGEREDKPLYALYRLYEWFLLDLVTEYRNELESFWRRSDWRICDIPDPQDDDPARYAFLAGVSSLLVTSFNRKIDYGASRNAPAIMTQEYTEALLALPKAERRWEELPTWADAVRPLEQTLDIPSHNGERLDGLDDPRADPYFKGKNIVLWTPHIHFT